MTRVDFLHDVTDKLAVAARLAARCYAEQHRAAFGRPLAFGDEAGIDRRLRCLLRQAEIADV